MQVTRERFAEIVGDALDSLPDEFAKLMRNVVVTIDAGEDPDLLGLYEGVPLTERTSDYSAVLPDKITIYQDPISSRATNEHEIAAQVRTTVMHEIGHHFGIDDAKLHELGW